MYKLEVRRLGKYSYVDEEVCIFQQTKTNECIWREKLIVLSVYANPHESVSTDTDFTPVTSLVFHS